jgi:hypothetical protein
MERHKLKSEFYGITGSFYNLIKCYLEHKYQRVQIFRKFSDNLVHSEWEWILCGVLQESILGPLLRYLFFKLVTDLGL